MRSPSKRKKGLMKFSRFEQFGKANMRVDGVYAFFADAESCIIASSME